MNYFRASVLLSLLLAFTSAAQTIKTITRDGRYLYTDAGERFYIKGVAYQPQGPVADTKEANPFQEPTGFVDPLADASGCERDLPFLKLLTVNVIRVYSVNSSLNHDACMNMFSQAGIYVILDLSLPLNGSINAASPTWSTNLLLQYINTIDVFLNYDNVLGYNVANELVLANSTSLAPFVKAAARDTKAYLQSKKSTALVGYAAIDGEDAFVGPLAVYLSCDPSNSNSNDTSIDLYGLNSYRWCGESTFEVAYADTVSEFAPYNVVTYFSEFGCITSPPRLWQEVTEALYNFSEMSTWSGGIAFSYFPAQSAQGQFGMVTISTDGLNVTTSSDFTLLQQQYSNVTFTNSPLKSAVGAPTYPSCPANNSAFNGSPTLPPTPNTNACNCLEINLSCRYTPPTNNDSAIIGALLDLTCSDIGQNGGTCDDISSNGSTGVYGRVAGCAPRTQLSYVMDQFFYITNKNLQSCNFAGNATYNSSATTASASAVASSCFANDAAVFTPSAPATSASSPRSSSKNGSGASVSLNLGAIVGTSVMAIVAVMSAAWTLA